MLGLLFMPEKTYRRILAEMENSSFDIAAAGDKAQATEKQRRIRHDAHQGKLRARDNATAIQRLFDAMNLGE